MVPQVLEPPWLVFPQPSLVSQVPRLAESYVTSTRTSSVKSSSVSAFAGRIRVAVPVVMMTLLFCSLAGPGGVTRWHAGLRCPVLGDGVSGGSPGDGDAAEGLIDDA